MMAGLFHGAGENNLASQRALFIDKYTYSYCKSSANDRFVHGAQGPAKIEAFITGLLKKVPDFRFRNIQFFIDTPSQTFGEYSVDAKIAGSDRHYKQTYAGRRVAEDGKIKLLRESLDTLAAWRAFSP